MEMEQTGVLLLAGISGSGKSSWAARQFAPYQVLSSDHFRGLVSGWEEDQTATPDAFWLLHEALEIRLRRGVFTVIDATNLEAVHREYYTRAARWYRVSARVVLFQTPLVLCLERNRSRPGRQVPEPVLMRQHEAFMAGLEGIDREGFDAVLHVYPGEDEVVV